MVAFDPHASWRVLEERAEATTNPRHRTLLTAVRDHMEAEITGRLEPLMATLADEPVYHFWGATEPAVLEGQAAVRTFYEDMIGRGGNQFQVVSDRIVVDDDFVVTEGHVRQIHTGSELKAAGLEDVAGEPLADDEVLLGRFHLVTVWPAVADGRLLGEDIFFAESPLAHLERVRPEQIPDYVDWRRRV